MPVVVKRQYTEADLRGLVKARALAQLHRPDHGNLYRDSSNPYNWPPAQFDCSVFIHWLWTSVGVNPDQQKAFADVWPQPKPADRKWSKYEGYTMTQLSAGKAAGCEVDFAHIDVGDALYYSKTGSSEHHVVLYIGGGMVVHAAATSLGVILSPVVPPGTLGHGGKHFVGAVSLAASAKHVGALKPTVVVSKPPTPPVVTPPVAKPPVKPAVPTVSLSAIQKAAKTDPQKAQGYVTYAAGVKLVEAALVAEHLLPSVYGKDGSYGTLTLQAYAAWQLRCGFKGSDADGIPGATSLVRLGRKYGFTVVK